MEWRTRRLTTVTSPGPDPDATTTATGRRPCPPRLCPPRGWLRSVPVHAPRTRTGRPLARGRRGCVPFPSPVTAPRGGCVQRPTPGSQARPRIQSGDRPLQSLCEGGWEGAASRRNPGPGPDAPRPRPRASRSRPKPRGAWSRPGEGALLPAACDSGLPGTAGSGAEVGELLVCSGGRALGLQGRLCRDGSTLPSKHEDGQRH